MGPPSHRRQSAVIGPRGRLLLQVLLVAWLLTASPRVARAQDPELLQQDATVVSSFYDFLGWLFYGAAPSTNSTLDDERANDLDYDDYYSNFSAYWDGFSDELYSFQSAAAFDNGTYFNYSAAAGASVARTTCNGTNYVHVQELNGFSDGSSPYGFYSNDLRCQWIITADFYPIELHFTRFELEDGYDFVHIYERPYDDSGGTAGWRSIATDLTGERGEMKYVAAADGPATVVITLTTDYSVADHGFYLVISPGQ